MASIYDLLKTMIERGASDLHITTGSPPRLRVDGKLVPLDLPALSPAETKGVCYSILTDSQKHKFEESNELDLSFGVKGLSRFRGNIFMQRGAVAGAFRTIPFEIRTFQDLGLPEIVNELVKKPRGLILVTGATGSGKSTTLAAMVDRINSERYDHIITVEDPIEYLHSHKKCLINQREVNADTSSFKAALRYVLRQDPDVVLIGEMRDLETIEAALTVAETGHLTLATLHTNSAVQTINRVIDVFPPPPAGTDKGAALFCARGDTRPAANPQKKRQGESTCDRAARPESGNQEPNKGRQDTSDLLDDADRTGKIRHADDEPVADRTVFEGASFL